MSHGKKYTTAARQVLERLAAPLRRIPKPGVETVLVEDPEHEHLLLLRLGWHDGRRVNNVVAHVRARDGKLWVEADNTDADVAGLLAEAGVPAEEIVVASHPLGPKPMTAFAPA